MAALAVSIENVSRSRPEGVTVIGTLERQKCSAERRDEFSREGKLITSQNESEATNSK